MYCIFGVKLVAFVLLLGLADCACPPGYRFGEKCYLFKDTNAHLAENVALYRKWGGTLVTIGTKAENDFLSSILGKDNYYWIGLKRPTVDVAQFTWFDGSPVNYSNWQPSDPDQLSELVWGATLDSSNGYWYDYSAKSDFYQLCQWIDEDSKKLERVTRVVDQLVKGQEGLTRDLSEVVKQAIGRGSDVTRNLTIALEKIANINHRLAVVETSNGTSNRTSNIHPRITRIGRFEGIEILQP